MDRVKNTAPPHTPGAVHRTLSSESAARQARSKQLTAAATATSGPVSGTVSATVTPTTSVAVGEIKNTDTGESGESGESAPKRRRTGRTSRKASAASHGRNTFSEKLREAEGVFAKTTLYNTKSLLRMAQVASFGYFYDPTL